MPGEELADLIEQLSRDPIREDKPFSIDIEECHRVLFDPQSSRLDIEGALRKWLKSHPNQPCLFGRLAASEDRISFCILKEADIERGDDYVREVIQRDRRIWKADALEGTKHAFIIAVISEKLSNASPDAALQRIAERVCDLYLFDQTRERKRHDVLRVGSKDGLFRKWLVGVNVFSTQGDGRWWSDHRIPGGVAFSMNSVGHMSFVRGREKLPAAMNQSRDSLITWTLPTAMRTIHIASKGPRFGTCLMDRARAKGCPAVPEELRKQVFVDVSEEERSRALRDLAGFSEHIYEGWYDTDESIPAEYFAVGVERPAGIGMIPLYFTYLHSYSDADYESMGIGEQLFAVDATEVIAENSKEHES